MVLFYSLPQAFARRLCWWLKPQLGQWAHYVVHAEKETTSAFRGSILKSESNSHIRRPNSEVTNVCMGKQETAVREHVKSSERRKIPSYGLSVLTVRHTSLTFQEGIYVVDSSQVLL